MTSGAKFAVASVAAFVLAVGVELLYLHHRNAEPGVAVPKPYEKPRLTQDDMVFLRKQRPDSLKDERALIGKTIWVSAGGQLDYYADAGNHIDYAHRVGTLLGAEPLNIKAVFEQKAPATGRAVARIAAGQKQVLLAFTMPNSAEPKKLFATPIGYFEAGNYTFFSDEIFFYDDPHQLYKHWGADAWAHIDKHETFPGMSETQAMMALGQVMVPSSDSSGNRTVDYNNNDHPIRIVFENNKATNITADKP